MPTVEYRLKGETKSRERSFSDRARNPVIIGKPNKIYELRDVDSDQWQECRADNNGEIKLYITLDGGVQCA